MKFYLRRHFCICKATQKVQDSETLTYGLDFFAITDAVMGIYYLGIKFVLLFTFIILG